MAVETRLQARHERPGRRASAALEWSSSSPARRLAPVLQHVVATDLAQTQRLGHNIAHIPIQPTNGTGLPDSLKAVVERRSGVPLDDVRVHPDSARPARLHALAYTQGADIYLGPGQQRHLPHEAWHVVQQKQGRVKPTHEVAGVAVNDEPRLEAEADHTPEQQPDRNVQRATADRAPIVQRLHGATPVNFGVTDGAVDDNECIVRHGLRWESSTGTLDDLADFQSREQVTFLSNPVLDVPAYGGPLAPGMVVAGNVLTKAVGVMSSGGGGDEHRGAANATAFNFGPNPNLRKAAWVLTGTQFYQYKQLAAAAWTNLHVAPFTITRTMLQPTPGNFTLTLTKTGPFGVNLTAGPTPIYDHVTSLAMQDVSAALVDQTGAWNATRTTLVTTLGLAIDPAFAHDVWTVNGVPVDVWYEATRPNAAPSTVTPADYTLPVAWRNTIRAQGRSAGREIMGRVLAGRNPPTRIRIMLINLPMGGVQVQQQAFWTNEGGGTYRVILRADKIMSQAQHMLQSQPGRESQRRWTSAGRIERYAQAVVVHELGHMVHAFADPDKFLVATSTIANLNVAPGDPLITQKQQIARINTDVMLALNARNYKAKWSYATNPMVANPAEVVAEVFTALTHRQNVPKGLAAVYVAYGGIRSAAIDAALQESFGGPIPALAQPQHAIPIINQP